MSKDLPSDVIERAAEVFNSDNAEVDGMYSHRSRGRGRGPHDGWTGED